MGQVPNDSRRAAPRARRRGQNMHDPHWLSAARSNCPDHFPCTVMEGVFPQDSIARSSPERFERFMVAEQLLINFLCLLDTRCDEEFAPYIEPFLYAIIGLG